MSQNFPRTRDEWLEPPDDDGAQDYFNDYILENYYHLGKFSDEEVYMKKDNNTNTLVSIDFDDFTEDSDGDFANYYHEIDDIDVIWEMAMFNAYRIISEGKE